MRTPTEDYRRTGFQPPKPMLKGLDAVVNKCIGSYKRRKGLLEQLQEKAEAVDGLAPEHIELSDHALAERLLGCRERFRRGGRAVEALDVAALAAVREAADRRLGLRPFPVQLVGALALHEGFLAEMATGEGKTLTAGLAAVLAGWTKRPCHVVTVNDYLVERDARWLEPLYHFCGVRVGFVTAQMDSRQRQHGYGCDVTYATSKEILADFLRDRLRTGALRDPTRRLIRHLLTPRLVTEDGLVMRGLHTAIVDEADSVLIDEAVTPLIISAPHKNEALVKACCDAQELVSELRRDTDYECNLRYREVELTISGRQKVEEACRNRPGLWRGPGRRFELVKQALAAREFYLAGKQYIVVDGKIVIVDEFTGRPMPQRTWRQGMHQAIEAKENLVISDPTETIARLSFQRFFRCYSRLSGMTGTAKEAAGEFWQIYRLPVIRIPTNRPCIRERWPDRLFFEETSKWQAVVEEVHRLHSAGRPVLVGTRSVLASERLADLLAQRGLEFQLLNATRLAEEASIIAEAGQPSRITIATNMAGRGTDIKLGKGVQKMGGLHVIATERHESGRVDRQLFGRSARQGDPGSAQAFVSTEDELMQRYLPRPLHTALVAGLRSRTPGNSFIAKSCFDRAQQRAQRMAFKQRCAVLKMDTWLEDALSFAGAH